MVAAAALPFSLTPAQADNKVINYTSSKGKKLFISATTKLNIGFDGDPANLKIFLESLCHHTSTSNWMQIMSIPDQKGTCQSIIDEYGQITMLDVHIAITSITEGTVAMLKTVINCTCASCSTSPERYSSRSMLMCTCTC